ncbi:MAG: type II toxin-antitoxin system YoeB family toxin [Nitrospirae bacterium]|nr:type II toxin-antitoxin system YoeB family toxin [Candidatus Troglogloeales bacterium]
MGAFSRRINLKHRVVYHLLKDVKAAHVVRMRSHYE